MSRQTFTLSAAAIIATAGFSFTSADGAEAIAPVSAENAAEDSKSEQSPETEVEIVPLQTEFVSQEVVQEVPEPVAWPQTNDTNYATLGDLVSSCDSDTELTEQMHCLAGAVYFESRGEPLAGRGGHR